MSHSWSSAPHWKCGILARVSRVRIPSSPPEIIKPSTIYVEGLFLAGNPPLFHHKVTSMYNDVNLLIFMMDMLQYIYKQV